MNIVWISVSVVPFRKPTYPLLYVDSLINAYLLNPYWTPAIFEVCGNVVNILSRMRQKSKRDGKAVDKAGNVFWVGLCDTYGKLRPGGSISLLSEALLLNQADHGETPQLPSIGCIAQWLFT